MIRVRFYTENAAFRKKKEIEHERCGYVIRAGAGFIDHQGGGELFYGEQQGSDSQRQPVEGLTGQICIKIYRCFINLYSWKNSKLANQLLPHLITL